MRGVTREFVTMCLYDVRTTGSRLGDIHMRDDSHGT